MFKEEKSNDHDLRTMLTRKIGTNGSLENKFEEHILSGSFMENII